MTAIVKSVRRFGDFELFHRIGRDGPFHLFRARQISLNRLVTLKVLPERSATMELSALLRREAEASDKLDHSNIVRVFERGEIKGTPYLALAHQDGEWLADRLRSRVFPSRRAAETSRHIASALLHAHDHGVLHGSLRPEVIWVGPEGQARVSGFGCPVQYDSLCAETVASLRGYLAPEQAGSLGVVTAGTDVYGLGAVLFAMITGSPPHMGATLEETCRLIREHPTVSPSRLQPGVMPSLDAVCMKCLSGDAKERYGLERPMARLIADLRRVESATATAHWTRRLKAWHDRHGGLVRALALIVPITLLPAVWDVRRHHAHWSTLSRRTSPAENHARAARYFELESNDDPKNEELAAAVALGRFRTGQDSPIFHRPIERLDRDCPRWVAVRAILQGLYLVRTKQIDRARGIVRSARERDYQPRSDVERELFEELVGEVNAAAPIR